MNGQDDRYDVVIVGAGATGSWAAMDLTARGARVAVLDSGAELDPEKDFVVQTHSYLHHDAARLRTDASVSGDDAAPGARQPIQSQHGMWNPYNAQHWVDDLSNPYVSTGQQPMQWFQGGLVGGRSNLWGGGCLRLSDHELQEWPIDHSDLAPYYDRVERTLAVAGTAEGLRQLPDGAFLESAPLTAAERRFKEAIERRWPDRRVTRGRGPVRKAWAAGESPPFTGPGYGLEVARRTGRMTLLARAAAHQVLTRDGAAVGVSYVDRESKERREVLGGAVLLCASTIQTARLLLNSAPGGLANSSGMVGRNLMDHTLTTMFGMIPGLPTETYRGLGEHLPLERSLLVPRFRNLGEPSPGFQGGYGIWAMVGWDSAPDRWPEGDGHSPMPGAFEGAVLFMANALGEVLPRPENGVEIDPHRQDADGIPIVRIHLDHGPNEARMREDALASLREMLGCVGGVPIGEHLLGPGSSIHEVGTARMGVDPGSSVVKPDNETWDVRNLFISDGACWPTSGWQNVTLTLIAITARCCDAIAERLCSSPPR